MMGQNSSNLGNKSIKKRHRLSSFFSYLSSYTLKSTSAFGDEILFVLFIFAFTVARFFGIVIHEVGHGLMAIALGGDFFAFYASPGTGISYLYTESLSEANLILVSLGGIMAQVAVGTIILIAYKTRKNFMARLFSLQLLLVLLVYPFLYLGLSVFFGGDGAQIVIEIQRVAGFDASTILAASSFLVMAFFAHLVSLRVMAFLKDYFTLVTRKEAFYKFFLFFTLPLWMGLIGAALATSIIPLAFIQFFIAFLLVANLLFIVEAAYISWKYVPGERTRRITRAIPGWESNSVISSFVVAVLVWAIVFGPTPSTAHGIMLKDPPLGAEKYFEDRVALNIDVRLTAETVEVDIVSRGLQEEFSRLEEAMWHTYDSRTHWPSQENRSLIVASSAFDATGWNIRSREIGSTVYGFDQYYEYPRIVGLATDFDTVLKNSSGTYILTIYDPWINEPSGPTDNYLHKLNISWSSGIRLLNHTSVPLNTPMSDLTTYVEWRNNEMRVAPARYVLEFSKA
jgi:hypothetical protein